MGTRVILTEGGPGILETAYVLALELPRRIEVFLTEDGQVFSVTRRRLISMCQTGVAPLCWCEDLPLPTDRRLGCRIRSPTRRVDDAVKYDSCEIYPRVALVVNRRAKWV